MKHLKKIFILKKVINISITSNVVALESRSKKAKELGLSTKTISYQIFESAEVTNKNFLNVGSEFDLVIGGGEK